MEPDSFNSICFPSDEETESIWDTFHVNSKAGAHSQYPSNADVLARMATLHESLPYASQHSVSLPVGRPKTSVDFWTLAQTRSTPAKISPKPIDIESLAAVLRVGYGLVPVKEASLFPRKRRTVPSAGALYPLELYFYSSKIRGIDAGLWHFDPIAHSVNRIKAGDLSQDVAKLFVQADYATSSTVVLFVTAVFERSVFKYGDRGYRFVLLEAGHVMQNISLACGGLGLGCIVNGGYFDDLADRFLDIDGVSQSTVYCAMIGASAAD